MDGRDVGLAQVRAHRFARDRLEEALTSGSVASVAGPGRLRRRQVMLSYAAAIAILAASGVLALTRPAPDWAAAAVLVESGSGAVFVNRAGVLHPALNLTSALLAAPGAGTSVPMAVSGADIASAPRGPTLGIPGAPARLPAPDRLTPSDWSLCDGRDGDDSVVSTEVVGSLVPGVPLRADAAVLAVPTPGPAKEVPPGRAAQLLWAGRRTPVDLADSALVRVLSLAGVTPRPLSTELLGALPATGPFPTDGPPGTGELPDGFEVRDVQGAAAPVGTVLRTARSDGSAEFHLIHRDGVAGTTPLLADLLRYRTGARAHRCRAPAGGDAPRPRVGDVRGRTSRSGPTHCRSARRAGGVCRLAPRQRLGGRGGQRVRAGSDCRHGCGPRRRGRPGPDRGGVRCLGRNTGLTDRARRAERGRRRAGPHRADVSRDRCRGCSIRPRAPPRSGSD